MEKTRLRIRFTKSGDLRWISHRDLARVWERLLRRANLQLAFSQGFHPKPRISFPSALALGVEALDEIVELEIVGDLDLVQIESDIAAQLPEGMSLLSIESPAMGLGKAKVTGMTYRIQVPSAELAALEERIAQVLRGEVLEITRDSKTISCDVRDPNFELRIDVNFLVFSIPNLANGSIRSSELLEHVGLGHLLEQGETLQRTRVHLKGPEIKTTS